MLTLETLRAEFVEVLGVEPPADKLLATKTQRLLETLANVEPVTLEERITRLFALVNSKFAINNKALADLYSFTAKRGVTFNFHEKKRIAAAFDRRDAVSFAAIVQSKGLDGGAWSDHFAPATPKATIKILKAELASPTLKRKDSKPGDRSHEIKRALFGGYVFSAFPVETVHQVFDPERIGETYEPDFFRHLHKTYPSLFSRDPSLILLTVPPHANRGAVAGALVRDYEKLANHGFLAIHLRDWSQDAWAFAAELTLIAEKFRPYRLSGGYFQAGLVEQQTRDCVPIERGTDCAFDIAYLGYQYRDTFVFANGGEIDLVLLFQKNEPDDTLIPCPACRSHDARGNSYSSIGVRSWECENPFCPDRSKFDRGKRYSFQQLLKQEAIEDAASQIPPGHVRSWARDVQPHARRSEIVELLIRHYTLVGDGVILAGTTAGDPLGRRVTNPSLDEYLASVESEDPRSHVLNGPYFSRFICDGAFHPANPVPAKPEFEIRGVAGWRGDSTQIMKSLPECSVDGAVTSPPYYNAREYSQWSNIYCYLFDMYQNAKAVYRVLKPGAFYLFNIFDYFDNENNITHSAMGDKRMILSAYCCRLFDKAGFNIDGNVVWDKGDIEGKRAFNGGNFSPYYQAPFNCWEHIIVARKPGDEVKLASPFPSMIRQSAVFKMIRGENTYGHTAPFPVDLPLLLAMRLRPGATVLDPYAGSMTTGVAALAEGLNAICIERDPEYFKLGRRLVTEAQVQLELI